MGHPEHTLSAHVPRAPTRAERKELRRFIARETEPSLVDGAYIAVFDGYASDGPGYQGRAMCVIWSGGAEFFDVFIWLDGQLKRVRRDG